MSGFIYPVLEGITVAACIGIFTAIYRFSRTQIGNIKSTALRLTELERRVGELDGRRA